MATTVYVELWNGEQWQDVVEAFMAWCHQHRHVGTGGCNEGDEGGPSDGRRYAAISIPDHSPALAGYLGEWAATVGRSVG
jgi:hypothetical protein